MLDRERSKNPRFQKQKLLRCQPQHLTRLISCANMLETTMAQLVFETLLMTKESRSTAHHNGRASHSCHISKHAQGHSIASPASEQSDILLSDVQGNMC